MHASAYRAASGAPLADYAAGSSLLRALASPVRLAIVRALIDADCCVHELMALVELPQAQVSQHLRVLRDAQVVSRCRRGREVVYSVASPAAATVVDTVTSGRRSAAAS